MAWPPKIAHTKPHERPDPFDAYFHKMKTRGNPEFPAGTDLLHRFCRGDAKKFEDLVEYLRDAFEAGRAIPK